MRRVLQEGLGLKYLNVRCRDKCNPENRILTEEGVEYSKKFLKIDKTINPFLECIGGHAVCPYLNLEKAVGKIDWFTIFREPIDRFLSHYQYENQYPNPPSIYEWEDQRKAPVKNLQVLYLAGRWDLEAAKQIFEEKINCFGVTSMYEQSLAKINHKLFDGKLYTQNIKKMNISEFNHKKGIKKNIEKHKDFLEEKNNLDMKLFDFVKEKWDDFSIGNKSVSGYLSKNIKREANSILSRAFNKVYAKCVR